jgi:hypothetical protein
MQSHPELIRPYLASFFSEVLICRGDQIANFLSSKSRALLPFQ